MNSVQVLNWLRDGGGVSPLAGAMCDYYGMGRIQSDNANSVLDLLFAGAAYRVFDLTLSEPRSEYTRVDQLAQHVYTILARSWEIFLNLWCTCYVLSVVFGM